MPSLLSTRLDVDRMLLRSTFEAGRSVMAPTSHSAVVPAKAGTHNSRRSLSRRSSAARSEAIDSAVWVPAFAGTTGGYQSLFSPCCHLRQRARGLPRSRKNNAAARKSVIAFPLLPFATLQSEPGHHDRGQKERDHG